LNLKWQQSEAGKHVEQQQHSMEWEWQLHGVRCFPTDQSSSESCASTLRMRDKELF
jgi:hypothetical protein